MYRPDRMGFRPVSGQYSARYRGPGGISRAVVLGTARQTQRNSNAAQRIALLEKCLTLLGHARIGLVVGDREFVGHRWLKWLKDNGVNFVMRLPKHQLLTDEQGRRQAIADWGLAVGQVRRLAQRQVDGVWGHVWVKALAGSEFLFLFGTPGLQQMGQLYTKRWTIEQCFQNLKGRGFHLESSHLACHHKLRKLLALVNLAYAFCLSVGQAADRRQPVARFLEALPGQDVARFKVCGRNQREPDLHPPLRPGLGRPARGPYRAVAQRS